MLIGEPDNAISLIYFLWYMARKGYTLQKATQKLEFEDVSDDIEALKSNAVEVLTKIIQIETKKP